MRWIRPSARWRSVPIVAILLLLPTFSAAASPHLPIAAQAIEGTTTIIQIDAPAAGETVRNGDTVRIQGWAADMAGPGTGIAEVHIYLDGQAGQGGTALGAANYGAPRPDVAAAYGRSDWANVGFEFSWSVSGLSPGTHTIYVYARSTTSGWQYQTVTVNVSAPATPAPPAGMPPGPPGPGPGGLPYGVTPPQSGPQSGYGTGYPYGDLYGPAGRPCIPFSAPGYWGHSPFDPYDTVACPPPPPPAAAYPPGPPPPILPGAAEVVPAQASPAGTVGLSWAGVPNASEYRIYQSTNAFSTAFTLVKTLTQTLGSLNTSTTITGLTPGATYFFSVRAVVNGIEQRIPASVTATGTTVGGPPPPQVQVTGVTSTTVTLAWTPVPGAVQYRITQAVGNSSVFTGAVTSNIGPNGATVIGLQPSTTYTFRVSAIDSFGVEGPFAIVQATTSA